MCGIAGIISKNNSVSIKDAVYDMSQAIKHRGPDGEGFVFFSKTHSVPVYSAETPIINKESKTFLFNPSVSVQNVDAGFNLAFAHRRLSIIDLSESGHQPMCDTQGDYWITFNGEVYNYIELREELKSKGHVFVTQTDTEVVLEAYKEWGFECLQKFNGMFALSLYDKQNNQIFCARDRVGVKPFYYSNTDSAFAFASEYKAFIKSKLIPFEINEMQQFDFIVNGNLENQEQSLFKGIYELKPSHYLVYNLGSHTFNINCYYHLPINSNDNMDEAGVIAVVEEKLLNAIRLRLRSDVEVGSCLSGGLDSSIIAGVTKLLQPDNQMKLFTAVFPNETFDETNYAKEVANFVGANWFTVSPTADEFFRDIESLNYFQDLPVWSTSTYSQHRVMKLASENNIKVVLDGQGADELFAGYSHHYMALWKENIGLGTFKQIIEAKETVPNGFKIFAKSIVKDTFGLSVDYSKYFSSDKKQLSRSKSEVLASGLNRQIMKDYNGRLKSYLKCEDRCSMAFGIESRVPFADDVELVNFLFSVNGNRKIKNGISKYLLREASKKYIPTSIYARRDKIGFETPVKKWFMSNKSSIIEQINSQLKFVEIDKVNLYFEELLKQKPNFILRLYSFAIWKSVFSKNQHD
ncbi:MAG TPA: asparagine synthase (glutamine-hydrolyzing) [Bacteroidia bacterium]|nr:asparagine synthase (glutamine-hydrolyzing) [Bacteroidia bacterium]